VYKSLPTIITYLQGLEGLTKNEAKAFIKICSKESVCVSEIETIFSDLGDNISRSYAYKIVKNFTRKHLLFPIDTDNNAQYYKAIHPNALLDHLKGDHVKLEQEIALLAESYETADYEEKDPKLLSRMLKSESEILTAAHVLHQKKHTIIIVHKNDPQLHPFFHSLEPLGETIVGAVDVILFASENQETKGIIELTKRIDKEGNIRVFGSLLYDAEKYDYYHGHEVSDDE
jgi:sugar-specific transcriptional regulator TrmB